MKRTPVVVAALALSFLAGLALAYSYLRSDSTPQSEAAALPVGSSSTEDAVALVLPVAAQEAWFPPIGEYQTGGEPLEDKKFDELLAALAERMEVASSSEDFEREAKLYLYGLVRRIALPELTPDQVERADAELGRLAKRFSEQHELLEKWRQPLRSAYAKATDTVMPFALSESWFPLAEDYDTQGRPFADETIAELIGILEVLLTMPETVADFDREARIHFFGFMRALHFGQLTDEQTGRIGVHLDQISARHPENEELIEQQRFFVQNLLPGNQAPNIVGSDINGVEFELHDYLGDVVVIYFSGDWCGPCQGEYPYKRLMLEIFEDQSVTILGVNSDDDLQTVRDMKESEGLDYRVWWDGHADVATEGPIAKAWNVVGWPTIYVLDSSGKIRYTQKRNAGVIMAVTELLVETRERTKQQSAG